MCVYWLARSTVIILFVKEHEKGHWTRASGDGMLVFCCVSVVSSQRRARGGSESRDIHHSCCVSFFPLL